MENVSLTTLILAALAAGFAAGLWSAGSWNAAVLPVAAAIGTLWVNALRMTVLPLVTALVITSLGAVRPGAAGRLTARALLLFLAMLSAVGALAAVVGPLALQRLVLTAAETEKLRAAWTPSRGTPAFAAWFTSLVPANVAQAAAEGQMLPVLVFAVLLGMALATLPEERSRPVLAFFEGLAAAMLVILRWVLRVAPLGVFALGYTLAQAGAGVAGALGFYVLVACGLFVLVLVGLYALVAVARPRLLLPFARALLPAQAVALGARSSLAALPLLVKAAEDLRLPAPVAGLVLPLAMSLLRISAPASQVWAVLFAAHVFGLPLSAAQIAWAAAMAVLLSFSVPGVPNGSFLIMLPLFEAVGVPVQALGVLLAVDVVPDLVKTVANVTAHLAAVCMMDSAPGLTPGSGVR